MNSNQLKDAMLGVEKERKDIQKLITNAGRTNLAKGVETLTELHCELNIEHELLHQFQQSHSRVKVLKLRYENENTVHEKLNGASTGDQPGATVSTSTIQSFGTHFISPGAKVARDKSMVRMFLQYLAKEDLLKCAQVNREWSDQVVHLMTPTPTASKKDFLCRLNHPEGKTTGPKTFENSEEEEVLTQRVKISGDLFDTYETPSTEILERGQMLSQFGKHVRKLEVADDKDFSVVSSCLGQNGHCLSLEVLHLTTAKEYIAEELAFFADPSVRNMGKLKLNEFEFCYTSEAVSNRKSIHALEMFLDGILENSPGLEHLKIHPSWSFECDWKTDRFLKVLKSEFHTSKNLKSLEVVGHILDNFDIFSCIKFGPNLRKVILCEIQHSSIGFRNNMEQNQKSFRKFLKLMSQSGVEYLCISGKFQKNWAVRKCDIPCMPKLKELQYGGPPQPFILQLEKKFPSLETLSVCGYQTFEELLQDYSAEDKSVPRLIHKGLKKIVLEDSSEHWIFDPNTIGDLSVAFPNLSELEITPRPECDSVKKHQKWFQDSFHLISRMKNLKELKISFFEWKCDRLRVDLNKAFRKLSKTPNLADLTLDLFEKEETSDWLGNSVMGVIGAPKLRHLRYIWNVSEEYWERNPTHAMAITELERKNIEVILLR